MEQKPLAGSGASPEPRYDTATMRKVTALAERLKERHLETITAREMEAVGAEVGLDPAFIQEALEQLTATPRPRGSQSVAIASGAPTARPRREEFWSTLVAWSAAFGFPAFALLKASMCWDIAGSNTHFVALACTILPVPLAGFVGLLARRRKTGLAAGATLPPGLRLPSSICFGSCIRTSGRPGPAPT